MDKFNKILEEAKVKASTTIDATSTSKDLARMTNKVLKEFLKQRGISILVRAKKRDLLLLAMKALGLPPIAQGDDIGQGGGDVLAYPEFVQYNMAD